MKTLFENKYTCTEEIYREIYQHFYFTHPLYLGISVSLIIFALLTNIITLIYNSRINLPTIVYAAIYFILLNIMCRASARKRYQSDMKENMGRPVNATFYIRDDGITLKFSNTAANTTAYSDIKKVKTTKNLILLITESKVSLTLKKDSFQKGNLEEFETFLKNKGFKF